MPAISLALKFIMSMIGNCSVPVDDVWVLDKYLLRKLPASLFVIQPPRFVQLPISGGN